MRPVDDVVDVVALFDVEVVGRRRGTNISTRAAIRSRRVGAAVLRQQKQGNAALSQVRKADVAGITLTRLNRELRRIVLAEVSTGVAKPQIINQRRCQDFIVSQQKLPRVAVDARVAVDVVAGGTNPDGGRKCVTKVELVVTGKVVIESQRVASFVLRYRTGLAVISNVARIQKIAAGRRHIQENLLCYRVDELGRNDVQVRIGGGINRRSALRRL